MRCCLMKKTQEVPRMPASAFAIEIGELIPSGIFLLLALVLPFVFYHVGGGFLHRLQKHLPEWLCILTESYLKPLAWALRQTLFFAAVGLLPPVETPTDRLPRRTRAGKRKLHAALSSTTFTGMFRPRHRADIR